MKDNAPKITMTAYARGRMTRGFSFLAFRLLQGLSEISFDQTSERQILVQFRPVQTEWRNFNTIQLLVSSTCQPRIFATGNLISEPLAMRTTISPLMCRAETAVSVKVFMPLLNYQRFVFFRKFFGSGQLAEFESF